MAHDREYFRRRADDAGSGTFHKYDDEGVEVAGHLALAYAALARRRGAAPKADPAEAVDAIAVSPADPVPLMLQD